MAGLAVVDARGRGRLVEPDLPVAAVLRDVDRHALDARAAVVVAGAPLDLVVGAALDDRRRRQGRGGCHRVDRVGDRVGVLGWRRIEQHARRGIDLCSGRQPDLGSTV